MVKTSMNWNIKLKKNLERKEFSELCKDKVVELFILTSHKSFSNGSE